MTVRRLILLSLVSFCATALAQSPPTSQPLSFDDLHQQSIAKNPPDVTLEIVPETGHSTFHMGETIMISLRFSSANPDKYRAWHMTNRTGAGMVAFDVFHVDPSDGTADPFQGYQFRQGFGYQGGGPYSTFDRPFSIELNDWVRFDKPGKYRLFLDTVRLITGVPARGNTMARPTIAASSNILELEILPADQERINSLLATARGTLFPGQPGFTNGRADDRYQLNAVHTLKNLQTEEAAQVLLKALADPTQDIAMNSAVTQALYNSRHRSLVIEELKKICSDPNTAPPSALELLGRVTAVVPGTPSN